MNGRFIPPQELSAIACDARAEGDVRALRLIDHIQLLQAALAMRTERLEDAGWVAPEQLSARVGSQMP